MVASTLAVKCKYFFLTESVSTPIAFSELYWFNISRNKPSLKYASILFLDKFYNFN